MMESTTRFVPELLAPAGNLYKLKVACLYGADAVYLSGQEYGLRAASDNFNTFELEKGVAFAHARGVKVYVTLNGFLHDEDLISLKQFLMLLQSLKIDAVIVSDLGIVQFVKNHSDLNVHLSTQASCLSGQSALWWKRQGVSRLVLGREVSIEDAARIKDKSQLEIEMFIHGSMCMAFSGNCTISNYTSGRDSNRGGCAHSCRFEYRLKNSKINDDRDMNSFFMSSKDLMGVELIEKFSRHGIDSLKVEGRMKGPLYAANTTRVYKRALRKWQNEGYLSEQFLAESVLELHKMSHRDYTTASLLTPAGEESIHHEREGADVTSAIACGDIVQVFGSESAAVLVRHKFSKSDQIECLGFNGETINISLSTLKNVHGEEVEWTRPGSIVMIPGQIDFKPGMLLRMNSETTYWPEQVQS